MIVIDTNVVSELIRPDVAPPGAALGARQRPSGTAHDRDRVGRPIHSADAQIAAVCRCRGAVLATRIVKDFEKTGVQLINPWEHPA